MNRQADADPALGHFLRVLAADMNAHPERPRPLDPEFVRRMKVLTEGVEFDLDTRLDPARE